MTSRRPPVLLIGLDEPESGELLRRYRDRLPDGPPAPAVVHATLPKLLTRGGRLWVESAGGARLIEVAKVVYHGVFEGDRHELAGLALWGGPCLPSAAAMTDARLKLPCLARALRYSRFAAPPRGFISSGLAVPPGHPAAGPAVLKWGDWHCGENKRLVADAGAGYEAEAPAVVEPFLGGEAVRVCLVGPHAWQVRLAGDGWLKSIHHADAELSDEVDPALLADARRVADGFGLDVLANDYIVPPAGDPHLLEVNHAPNVTRFPAIREAYLDHAAGWLAG